MFYLYSAGGSSSLQILHSTYGGEFENEEALLFNVCQLLAARGQVSAASYLATLGFTLFEGTNDFNDEFCILRARLSLTQYEFLRSNIEQNSPTRKEFKDIFSAIATTISEIGPYIRFIVCELDTTTPPENWRADLSQSIATLGANQALFTFKDSLKIVHEGLNFRSKTEVKIFDSLVKRGLLVFPLPVAVLAKQRAYKEPDFVVCYKSKFGILEIHGDAWHPPITAAKEHESRRGFTQLGVNVYEIFDAKRCWNDPEGVIDDFLKAFN